MGTLNIVSDIRPSIDGLTLPSIRSQSSKVEVEMAVAEMGKIKRKTTKVAVIVNGGVGGGDKGGGDEGWA